jgi:uncharacterized membrane protein (DUF485 family)
MSGNRIDWNLVVAITALLITFVAAIPTVYIFQDKRFFWESAKAEQQIQQQNIQTKPETVKVRRDFGLGFKSR